MSTNINMHPFLTINQQIELLNTRGLHTDDKTSSILLRENYYSVINGYKEPFIDVNTINNTERFRPGTSFDDIYKLYLLDKELHILVLPYLMKAERLLKTVLSYTFSQYHTASNAYLYDESYCLKNEFLGKGCRSYETELKHLIKKLELALNSEVSYIQHYRNRHESVPLWVLINNVSFGVAKHMFDLMKYRERKEICSLILQATGGKNIGRKKPFYDYQVSKDLFILVKIRNKCAHGDRLYCETIGGNNRIGYIDMLLKLKHYLTHADYENLLIEYRSWLEKLHTQPEEVQRLFYKANKNSEQLLRI